MRSLLSGPRSAFGLLVTCLALLIQVPEVGAQPPGSGVSPGIEQPRPMLGGAEAPFTQFESIGPGTPDSFNYSQGASEAFEQEPFEQVQQGVGEDAPGAYRNTRYRWYGFVRLDGIYDFDPIASTDSFVTSAIPVPQGEGENVVLTPRYTRLGWDTTTDLDWSDYDVNTRIEVDFFNGNTSGVFGSYPLRMRFAWVEFGPILVGQAASLFMDYDVFPNVLDYQGPNGMILMRQGVARIKLPLFNDANWISLGVEQPYSDIQWDNGDFVLNPGTGVITDPDEDRSVQGMPDFTGNIRSQGDFGHVQVAGILRQLTFRPAGAPDEDEFGYGGNITGTWHPFAWWTGCSPKADGASPCAKSRFLAQYATGTGINRYFQDTNGLGLDAVFTPVNGFEVIDSHGWFVAYEHWWTNDVISNLCYSEMDVDLPVVLPGNTYESGKYLAANLIWLPFTRLGVGMEVLFGERQNQDGQNAEAVRIQTGLQYKF